MTERDAAPGTAPGGVAGAVEAVLFAARWLLAPVYLGLIAALVLIVLRFFTELAGAVPGVLTMKPSRLITLVLTLIDLSLAGNLLLIVMLSGFENFIATISRGTSRFRPSWLGQVGFGGLKLKLIASIVVIAAVHMLETVFAIGEVPAAAIWLEMSVLLGFAVTGVLLALMDRLEAH